MRAIVARLRAEYPDARTSLTFHTPLELLVATVLSAQSTDVRVNQVTPGLFAKYATAQAYVDAPLDALEQDIKPLGFYRTKAEYLHGTAQQLVDRFGGEVPRTMEELTSLPGIGRKTANVVLGNAYGIVEGIVVDTHVARVSRRLGLTMEQDPAKIEQDLMALVPREAWLDFSNLLISHGRAVCQARVPTLPELTSPHWVQIAALLPRSRLGRPARNYRLMVEGILWVMRTGGSWRALPDPFGPW
ncbi:MAG TPA: endonuclease III [Ktedonobacterales bacterium]|nr:endonuclease III [Ktedonobacterales bacterium]